MVALQPPDLLGGPGIPRVGPPGLATPGETETGQKERRAHPKIPKQLYLAAQGQGPRRVSWDPNGNSLPPAPLAWSSHSHVHGLLGSSPP